MVGDRFNGPSNYRIIRSHVSAKSNPYGPTVMDERPFRLRGRRRGYAGARSSCGSIRAFAVGQWPANMRRSTDRHSCHPNVVDAAESGRPGDSSSEDPIATMRVTLGLRVAVPRHGA